MKQFIRFRRRGTRVLYHTIMVYKIVGDELLFLDMSGRWHLSYMTPYDVPPGVKWVDFI